MTALQFRNWLLATYGCRQPQKQFLADFNAIAQAVGERTINWAKVNHWMYDRRPPERVGGLTFERVLKLIAERKKNPKAAMRIYAIVLPVDSDTGQMIEKCAQASGIAAEEWLRVTLGEALAKM